MKNLGRVVMCVASCSALFPLMAQADEVASAFTTSGNITMTSNYLYRGVTQSDGPAVQGSLTLSHESGAYVSVWGSSINFANNLELDPSVGYTGKVGELTYDVGALYYGYPNSSAANGGVQEDFLEFYGSISAAGAKVGLAYSPDFYNETGKAIYVNASYAREVAGLGLSAYVGYSILEDGSVGKSWVAPEDKFVDYKLSVSKQFLGVGAELAYVGTDLNGNDKEVVFSVSKSF